MSTTVSRSTASRKHILAIAVALILMCGLFPALASASELEAGQATDQTLSTQATKTVYVITGTKSTADWGTTVTTTNKYTYNKNGLVKTIDCAGSLGDSSTITYAYKGANLKSKKEQGGDADIAATYTVNKKGLITKAVKVTDTQYGTTVTSTFKGKYKSGKLRTIIGTSDDSPTTQDTFTYNYKNGRVASRTWDGSTLTYAYDAKGNLNNIGGSQYENTYNAKKRLTKTTLSEEGYSYEKTYTYKAIKVKASLADKVEAQQWAIINNNLNFAFGIDVL